MRYTPIQMPTSVGSKGVMGSMPTFGTNLQDDSQLLDTRSALWVENYLVHGVAKMQKRPGQIVNFTTGESTPVPLDEEYLYGYDVVAYGSKVRVYNNASGTFTNIKTDFTSGAFTGGRYGDYFFVNTPLDGLWRMSFGMTWAKAYNFSGDNVLLINKNAGTSIVGGQIITDTTSGNTATVQQAVELTTTTMKLVVNPISGAFTIGGGVTGGTLAGATLTNVNPFYVGSKVTGATSGATAIILEVTDNGATGTFVLGSILGTFQNGEVLTAPDPDFGGSLSRGTATSLVTIGITQVTSAPKANVFRIVGNRGILIGLASDPSGYNYSDADTGANPPFNNFTSGTGFTSPGVGGFRQGGQALDATLIGDIIFIGQANGWCAFTITQIDLNGESSKEDTVVATGLDFPVYRCVMSNVGMLVASKAGIHRLISLGQPNIPYSDQWENLTKDLGDEYFTNVTFDDVDIAYDSVRGFVYSTLDKSSEINNLVLAVKVDLPGEANTVKTGATSFLTGWNILNFLNKQGTIYGMSAVTGTRFELFTGQKDVDSPIYSLYVQELNFAMTDAYNLGQFYIKGELSPASRLTISFDTFDETGYYEPRRKAYTWTARHSYLSDSGGWGEAAFGSAGWGGGALASGLNQDYTGRDVQLRGLTRTFLRVECDDYSEHFLNWFSANASIIRPVRIDSLEEITS